MKRILLLTNFPCDALSGGAAIMRHWVGYLREARFKWVCLGRPTGQVPMSMSHVETYFYWLNARGNARLGLAPVWAWYKRTIWSGIVARRMSKSIATGQYDVVWIVFDFTLNPVILRLLPALRGQRVHMSLHDEPYASAQREECTAAFLSEIRTVQGCLPTLDLSVDSVSEELLADVAPYAKRTAIITLPAELRLTSNEFRMPSHEGPLRIGFSGNFHGRLEFEALVGGLDRWAQRSGREWSMLVYGNLELGSLSQRIQAHGPTSPEAVRVGLRGCDVLFLPSPLDRPEMRTNMPTKLVTYLELGRPVFAFAPAGSATERVICDHHLGPVTTDLAPLSVDRALDAVTNWNRAAAEAGWRSLLSARFAEERMGRDLADLLGLSWVTCQRLNLETRA